MDRSQHLEAATATCCYGNKVEAALMSGRQWACSHRCVTNTFASPLRHGARYLRVDDSFAFSQPDPRMCAVTPRGVWALYPLYTRYITRGVRPTFRPL